MNTLTGNYRSKLIILWVFLTVTFSISSVFAQAQTTPHDAVLDFNGDGKTDYSILRSAGLGQPFTWWNLENGTSNYSTLQLGIRAVDQPVPADYDGDGRDDIAMFRFTGPQAGTWYILQSSTGTYRIEQFGQAGDNPTIVDDYDGDGKDDLAVFRVNAAAQGPGPATFFYKGSLNNPQGNITYVPWGMRYGSQSTQVDDPYTGDFDGDGKADFGIQRAVDTSTASDGPAFFWVLLSSGGTKIENFGLKSDRVVPGDYDGDGKVDICVVRGFNVSPSPITWFIHYSSGIPDEWIPFGQGSNFNFAQGDYDGDGKTDIAFLVPSSGQSHFWIRSSAAGNPVTVIPWGVPGDLPAAGYNNR